MNFLYLDGNIPRNPAYDVYISQRLRNASICSIKDDLIHIHSKTSFEKNCFSAWASTLNMGLINKVDMVCLSPLGYGV